jgi:hypothetical protein
MRLPMRILAVGIIGAALGTAGCQRIVAGVAQPDRAHVAAKVSGNQINNVLLIPSELNKVAGVELKPRVELGRPVPGGLGGTGPCEALNSVGTDTFVGKDYTTFHVVLSSDGQGGYAAHVAAQSASIYPDASTAREAFKTGTSGIGGCNGRHVKSDAEWLYTVGEVTADTAHWVKEQTDAPGVWRCYGQARVRENVLLEAMACQNDSGGERKAQAILDRMSATVWELAGR